MKSQADDSKKIYGKSMIISLKIKIHGEMASTSALASKG
jgi:hypothetical protein